MKQIDECLDRVFAGKPPLKKKWRAKIETAWILDNHPQWLFLYHYHHLALVFDIDEKQLMHSWWELPTDKRGLDAAIVYLEKKYGNIKK